MRHKNKNPKLRVIRTARTEEDINAAARAGFFPLVKQVSSKSEVRSIFAVYQDPQSGEITVVRNLRHVRGLKPEEQVIGFTSYYPHHFPNPFAAYLIPADLAEGEVVILEDLIEDLVGARTNQGMVYRLEWSEATWDGKNFIIDVPVDSGFYDIVG